MGEVDEGAEADGDEDGGGRGEAGPQRPGGLAGDLAAALFRLTLPDGRARHGR